MERTEAAPRQSHDGYQLLVPGDEATAVKEVRIFMIRVVVKLLNLPRLGSTCSTAGTPGASRRGASPSPARTCSWTRASGCAGQTTAGQPSPGAGSSSRCRESSIAAISNTAVLCRCGGLPLTGPTRGKERRWERSAATSPPSSTGWFTSRSRRPRTATGRATAAR